MSTDVPTPPGVPDPDPAVGPPAAGPTARKPRKRFLIIGTGIGLAAILLFGLFSSIGASNGSGNGRRDLGRTARGGPVPAFSGTNVGPMGPATVSVPAGGTGTPTVLLFFGAWCTSCHQELPPLAAAVRSQDAGGRSARAHQGARGRQPRPDVGRPELHPDRRRRLPRRLRPERQHHQWRLLVHR